MSDISVIVPVLNEANTIQPWLQHLNQFDVEVIVVDGGSTDHTIDQVRPHAQIVSSAPGRAQQMNTGAALASRSILLFLHADTWLPPNADKLIEQALQQAQWGRFDVSFKGDRYQRRMRIIAWFMNCRSRLTRIATGDQGIFVTKTMFTGINGYQLMPLMEDVNLCQRLKRQSSCVCLTDKVTTSSRRWEQHGFFKTVFLMWKLRLYYWLGMAPEKLHAQYYGH